MTSAALKNLELKAPGMKKIALKSQIFGKMRAGDSTGKGQRIRFERDYKNQVRLVYVTLSGRKCIVNAYMCKIML